MARSFSISSNLSALSSPFPTPDQVLVALGDGTRREREMFVRLWLSEGVPFSFQECPAVFEELRGWLGRRLDVHPKEITLIGSGRIGYSLAKGDRYGRGFSENSDLDFSVVSSSLFSLIAQTFYRFSDDFESGRVLPTTEKEAKYWPENIRVCRRNIKRGFLDSNKIPNYGRYPAVQNINAAMWHLTERLNETSEAPSVKSTSIRIYRCWRSFTDQVSFNLLVALKDKDD